MSRDGNGLRDFRVSGGWNWLTNRTFIANDWKEMTDKYRDYPVLWTVGMRGIHDDSARAALRGDLRWLHPYACAWNRACAGRA